MAWDSSWGSTWLSSAKAKSRKANREELANDKLIPSHVTKGYLGGVMQCGIQCGACSNFSFCAQNKGVKQDTNYCVFRPSKFHGQQQLNLSENKPPILAFNPNAEAADAAARRRFTPSAPKPKKARAAPAQKKERSGFSHSGDDITPYMEEAIAGGKEFFIGKKIYTLQRNAFDGTWDICIPLQGWQSTGFPIDTTVGEAEARFRESIKGGVAKFLSRRHGG